MTGSIPSDINLSDNDESMSDLIEMVQKTEKKLSALAENYVLTVAVSKVLLDYGIDPNTVDEIVGTIEEVDEQLGGDVVGRD